ncbi:MAG: 4Fe-4S binding protein [bacterium]
MELSGDIDDLAAAEQWLETQGIGLDRATGDIRIDRERCVDCGICSSLCPSGALRCAAPSWQLHFDAKRCLLCEQCIPSCPLEAIALVLDRSADLAWELNA